ncbi:BadF/BadG/BcrA/BcrD ATPase family protein [Aliiroseovarius sp.]|uniref:BadF/BadG/BcrA/BcrD ATPase family protein n=1 Tax=Aliiroseovarius sp. TaxID=1872442 RepID=UPI003BACF875
MTNAKTYPIIAVDGGGTRCRIALKRGQDTTVVETGSANVTSNFDGAVAEIEAGLNALAEHSAMSLPRLTAIPAYVGLAGVTGPAIAERLTQALPFDRVVVEDDRPAALRGALGAQDGFVAHCGTGSFIAAQIDGQRRIVGGWGPVLGDPASAQWVGRHALSYTLDAADGLAPNTGMAQHFLSTLGGTAGVVAFAASARPADFGALAPVVTDHAEAGDALAIALMGDAAGLLVRLLTKMGWTPGKTICLTGGIGPSYATHLPAQMQMDLKAPLGEPLSGALSLAREFSTEVTLERG